MYLLYFNLMRNSRLNHLFHLPLWCPITLSFRKGSEYAWEAGTMESTAVELWNPRVTPMESTQCYGDTMLRGHNATGTQCYGHTMLRVHNLTRRGHNVIGTECYGDTMLRGRDITGTQCYEEGTQYYGDITLGACIKILSRRKAINDRNSATRHKRSSPGARA